MISLNSIKDKIKNNTFKHSVILALFLIFIFFTIKPNFSLNPKLDVNLEKVHQNELMVFVQDGCGHCREAEKFLDSESIKNKYNNITINYYNLKNNSSINLLFEIANRLNIPISQIGTPTFVMNDNYIIGFSENDKTALIKILSMEEIKRTAEQTIDE